MVIGCPFAFCFLLAVFWIFYKFRSKRDFCEIVESFFITTTITFFFFQSAVLNALLNLLSCVQIENNFYLGNYLLEQCSGNPNYEKFRNFMVIPAFSFFLLLFTIAPFYYMFKNRAQLYTDKTLRKVGFLLNGYSRRYYYWYFNFYIFLLKFFFRESVFLFRKISTILIISLVKIGGPQISDQNNAFFILLLNTLLFVLEKKLNPFGISELNSLNFLANFVIIMTLFGGLISSFNQQSNLSVVLMFIIMFVNLYFIVMFLKCFIQIKLSFFQKIKRYLNSLNNSFGKFWSSGF